MSKQKDKKPKVHKSLDGFSIEIDSFGEMKSNLPIEEINEFLNKNLDDKKLQERKDYQNIKTGGHFKKDKEKG